MSPEIHTYESVWDAVADDAEEAANLKLRSQLMDALEAYIGRESITQEEASRRFGVPRSRVSELVNGRISKFTIDKLVNMAARVGLTTRITVEQDARPSVEATAPTVSAAEATRRRGAPVVVLLGVEGDDWETVILETSPAFRDLVEARRKEPTLSVDELQRRLRDRRVRLERKQGAVPD